MKIYIDQSNKIEQTNKHTVLALANDKKYSILIPAKIKRQFQELFRHNGEPRAFIYITFAAAIVILTKECSGKLSQIVIDQEYYGKEKQLKETIEKMMSKFFNKIPNINFEKIGKSSNAHKQTYSVTKRKIKADKIVSFNELNEIIRCKSKTPNA